MLTLVLTNDDADDMRMRSGTINTLTAENVEVVLDPAEFIPPIWAVLDAGGKVVLEAEVIGQHHPTEVLVSL